MPQSWLWTRKERSGTSMWRMTEAFLWRLRHGSPHRPVCGGTSDFSYRGAKGIVALTGYNGILGYRTDISYETRPADLDANKVEWLDAHPDFSLEKRAGRREKSGGCHAGERMGVCKPYLGSPECGGGKSEKLQGGYPEIQRKCGSSDWRNRYHHFAFGTDLTQVEDYSGDKFEFFKSQGYNYFCNVDSSQYFVQIRDRYFRQSAGETWMDIECTIIRSFWRICLTPKRCLTRPDPRRFRKCSTATGIIERRGDYYEKATDSAGTGHLCSSTVLNGCSGLLPFAEETPMKTKGRRRLRSRKKKSRPKRRRRRRKPRRRRMRLQRQKKRLPKRMPGQIRRERQSLRPFWRMPAFLQRSTIMTELLSF